MKLDYDLLTAETQPPRAERINLGLVLWRDEMPEIVADVSARRLGALDPNYPRLPIFRELLDGSLAESLAQHLAPLPDIAARRTLLSFLLPPMRALPGGELFAEDGDFAPALERAMNALVRLPNLDVRDVARRKPGSRLESQFRHWLRAAHVMGRGMEDLSRHRVVSQFPVSVEADVYADFAYKNGALHVIETFDMRGAIHVTTALRNTAAFKSLTLDMARDVVGDGRRLGIVAASDYAAVKPALRLFERNADELFALDSPGDTQRLADLLARGLRIDGGLLPISLIGP